MADIPIPNVPTPDSPDTKRQIVAGNGQSRESSIAEWTLLGLALLVIAIWVFAIPKHPQRVYTEVELISAIDDARKRVKDHPDDKSAQNEIQERTRDLAVWTRYEEELREFEWISDLNWYLYAGFKILMIVGGVITPALIAKKDFGTRLAVLFSIVTAVSAGFITEFNYKAEASRAEKAISLLVTEKTLFITRSNRSYALVCCPPFSDGVPRAEGTSNHLSGDSTKENGKEPATSTQSTKVLETQIENKIKQSQTSILTDALKGWAKADSDLHAREPVPNPTCYEDARANFAYAITQIYGSAVDDRLLFLDKKEDTSGVSSSGLKSIPK